MKLILKKLHDVMSGIEYIQKDKENKFHGYMYASEQAIKEAVHNQLVLHKVVFTLSTKNINRIETVSEKGKKTFITDVWFEYRFLDVESGESVLGSFIGTGEDSGDKGTWKAVTGAIKYILTSTFLIPTGDDSEADNKRKESPVKDRLATKEEREALGKLAGECGMTIKQFHDGIKVKYKVGFTEVTSKLCAEITANLRKQQEAKKLMVKK